MASGYSGRRAFPLRYLALGGDVMVEWVEYSMAFYDGQ
jgi:hypothetical protein